MAFVKITMKKLLKDILVVSFTYTFQKYMYLLNVNGLCDVLTILCIFLYIIHAHKGAPKIPSKLSILDFYLHSIFTHM